MLATCVRTGAAVQQTLAHWPSPIMEVASPLPGRALLRVDQQLIRPIATSAGWPNTFAPSILVVSAVQISFEQSMIGQVPQS
jgi:hypothetical protein